MRGGVIVKDPSSYLCEIRRKPRKYPNGYVDRLDRELNPISHLPVLSTEPLATGGTPSFKEKHILFNFVLHSYMKKKC